MQQALRLHLANHTAQLLLLPQHRQGILHAYTAAHPRKLPRGLLPDQIGCRHRKQGLAARQVTCSSTSGALIDQASGSGSEVCCLESSEYAVCVQWSYLALAIFVLVMQVPANQQGYRHAILHDFCMGIPYGSIVLAAGLVSLIFGSGKQGIAFAIGGSGILGAAFFSLVQWRAQRPSTIFTLASAGDFAEIVAALLHIT